MIILLRLFFDAVLLHLERFLPLQPIANMVMSILNDGDAVCRTLLVKTSRVFLASARKSRPVFLPLKTPPPIGRRRDFSRQSEGRHNTLYFAFGKVCGKGYAPPR